MCQALNVSRSGYYAFLKRPPSARAERKAALLKTVTSLFYKYKRIYGATRITKELPQEQLACKTTVAKVMQENGLRSKVIKKYKATTNSRHNLPVAENILNREFTASRRNEKWVSDITYIATDEGWLYLAGILDLYDRSIVGWSMDSRMKTSLVISALRNAIGRKKPKEGLILHSDRGVQYASHNYQKLIQEKNFVCSMSRKGNCYDNAPMESFWGKLKTEWLNDMHFKTRDEARSAVFEYIELFYNRNRIHSSNDYIAPLKVHDAA